MPQPSPQEIQSQISELNALRGQAKTWRIGMILGLLVIVIGCVLLIINAVLGLAKPGPAQDAFMSELKTGMDSQVLTPVKQIAQKTMSDLRKDLEVELKKAGDRAPEIMEALNNELAELQQNIPDRGQRVLQATFGREFELRQKKIEKMFPGVNEEKIAEMVENIISESEASMEHLSHVLFGQHTRSLNGIVDHIDTIKKTEQVDPQEQMATWETALLVFDVLREELRVFEQDSPAKPAAPADAKAKEAKPETKTP
jgi:vacuolar-type H+-ATPase subunit H